LFQLRLDLVQLHARARDAGFLRAGAERVRDVHLRRPLRVLVAEQRTERIADTAWDSSGDLAAEDAALRAEDLRAAEALRNVGERQIRLRLQLLAQVAQRDVVLVDRLLRDREVSALAERAPDSGLDVDRLRDEVGPVDRIELRVPVRV